MNNSVCTYLTFLTKQTPQEHLIVTRAYMRCDLAERVATLEKCHNEIRQKTSVVDFQVDLTIGVGIGKECFFEILKWLPEVVSNDANNTGERNSGVGNDVTFFVSCMLV